MPNLLDRPRYILRWVNNTGGDWIHPDKEYIGLPSARNAALSAFVDEQVDKNDIVQIFQLPFHAGDDPAEEVDWSDVLYAIAGGE